MQSFLTQRYQTANTCKALPCDIVDSIVAFLPLTIQSRISEVHRCKAKVKASEIICKYITDWAIRRSDSCFPLCANFELQLPCYDCVEKFTPLRDRTEMRISMADVLVRRWLGDVFTLIDLISEDTDEHDYTIGYRESDKYVHVYMESAIIYKYEVDMYRQIWESTTRMPDDTLDEWFEQMVHLDACYVLDLIRNIEKDICSTASDEQLYTSPITVSNTAIFILLCSANRCFYRCVNVVSKWEWRVLVKECVNYGITLSRIMG